MKAARKTDVVRQIEATPIVDAFPIRDPDLAELSELLHRMQMCQEDTPATRMAGQAIKKLQAYVIRQAKAGAQQ